MLVNIYHDSRAEHRRLLFYGVVFVAIIAALIGTSIAIYQLKEGKFEPVTVYTDEQVREVNAIMHKQ